MSGYNQYLWTSEMIKYAGFKDDVLSLIYAFFTFSCPTRNYYKFLSHVYKIQVLIMKSFLSSDDAIINLINDFFYGTLIVANPTRTWPVLN